METKENYNTWYTKEKLTQHLPDGLKPNMGFLHNGLLIFCWYSIYVTSNLLLYIHLTSALMINYYHYLLPGCPSSAKLNQQL